MSKTSTNKYEFMKDWDNFANSRAESATRHPILMPINIDIVDGKLVRSRMKAPQVKKLYAKCRGDFPKYMKDAPKLFDNPDKIFKEYVKYFQTQDGVEGPGTETALDLHCICLLYTSDAADE